MEKKLNKPYSRNVRLDNPNGLLGVPPDMSAAAFTLAQDKVIMIVDRPTAVRLLSDYKNSKTLPS